MILNKEYSVIINDIDNNMNGISRIDNYVVIVPYALKDEKVIIKIVDIKKRYAIGRIIKIIEKSHLRKKQICNKYFECGGCCFLHVPFELELKNKRNELCKLFNLNDINILTDNELNYRNKATFHIVNGKIGYYSENTHQLVCFDKCILLDERINKIYDYLLLCDLSDIESVVVKVSNNEIMTIFKGNRKTFNDDGLFRLVDSVYLNNKLIYGKPYILMNIDNYKYSIYPEAFFQVNTANMKIMYDIIKEYAGYGKNLLDLYCGTGSIGIYLSKNFNNITGIEINKTSIENANINKKLNNLENINFICADAKIAYKNNYDVIVVDPPRSGISKEVVKYLNNSNAKRIIYVSCNPKTLKRDIDLLDNYILKKIEGINMFNKTKHVETVVLLSHKKPDGHINVKVEFGEGDGKVPLDDIAERAENYKPKERVTYKMIKEYIEAKYGFKVHTAYIAEVKRDLGLPMYDAHNVVEKLKNPRKHPTPEKVEAIKDALKHFEVI